MTLKLVLLKELKAILATKYLTEVVTCLLGRPTGEEDEI